MDTLASRLKIVLDQKGLTQEKFAEQIGVSQPSVFKILNGQTRNPTRIYEIANVLDVDVNCSKTGKGEAPDILRKSEKSDRL